MELFYNTDAEDTYKKLGFFKTKLGDTGLLNEFIFETDKLIKSLPVEYKKGFHALALANEPEIRIASSNLVSKYIVPILSGIVKEGAQIIPGVHMLKFSGIKGNLGLHQDSSHIDELNALYATAWIPLQDVNFFNGCLRLVPGSHIFGNRQRGLTIPDLSAQKTITQKIKKRLLLNRYNLSIPAKKGEVIFFHPAVLHGSSLNLTLHTRIACTCMVKAGGSELLHYFRDSETPAGKVDVFRITKDYYYTNNFMVRPSKDATYLRTEDLKFNKIDFSQIAKSYKQAKSLIY